MKTIALDKLVLDILPRIPNPPDESRIKRQMTQNGLFDYLRLKYGKRTGQHARLIIDNPDRPTAEVELFDEEDGMLLPGSDVICGFYLSDDLSPEAELRRTKEYVVMEIGPRMDPKIKMPFCRIDVEPRAYQNVRRTGLDSYEADVLFGLSATPVESYSPIQLLDMLEVDGPTGNVAKSVVEVLKFSMEARRNVIARYDPVENMLFNKLQDAAQRMLQILACAHSVTDVLPAEGFKEGYSMQYPYKRLFVDSFINHSPRLLEMIQEFYEPDNFALGPTEMSRTYIGVPRLMIKKDADQDRS